MATRLKKATKSWVNSKSSKGSGGLKKNKLNIKLLALFVLPVAIIGGFFVYKTKAATWTFFVEAMNLRGGNTYVEKGTADSYRTINGIYGSPVYTNTTSLPASSQICTRLTITGSGIGQNVNKATVRMEVSLRYSANIKYYDERFDSPGKKTVCLNTDYRADVKSATVRLVGFPEDSGIGVHSIYGKP